MPRQKWKNKAGTREYYAWRSMKRRCLSPKDQAWRNYGGRGISVCEKWLKSYDAFFEDMGSCPDGHSLDRIDVEKGYSPENCRWADIHIQSNNRRNNVVIKFEGRSQTMSQWAKELGLQTDTLFRRLQRMPPEKALTSENLVEKNKSPLIHGTRIGYEGYKCRCDLCRAFNTQRHRDFLNKKSKS